MEQLLAWIGGIASVAILGTVKKVTGVADTKIGAVLKPIQPVVALGLATALPYVTHALHLTSQVDATQLAAAPTGTIIGIVAAELLSKLQKQKPTA